VVEVDDETFILQPIETLVGGMSGREPEVGWRAFYYEANRKNKRFIE